MKVVLVQSLFVQDDIMKQFNQQLLELGHELAIYQNAPVNEAEWLDRCQKADVIMLANCPMPDCVIKQCQQLKYINIAFTGYNHVNVKLAQSKGIIVSNAACYSTVAVSELVLGLTLNLARQINVAHHQMSTQAKASDFLGFEISGKTVGIIGTGEIGYETARLFKAFNANLIGYSRSKKQNFKDLGLDYMELDEVFQKADVISIHLPQNEQTVNFINKHHFDLMKPSSLLINCARGPIVNQSDLIEALKDGKIAGAGIDVFDIEPPLMSNHPLLNCPNVVLTPHIGYFTQQAMMKRAQIVFENTLDFVQGKAVKTVIK